MCRPDDKGKQAFSMEGSSDGRWKGGGIRPGKERMPGIGSKNKEV